MALFLFDFYSERIHSSVSTSDREDLHAGRDQLQIFLEGLVRSRYLSVSFADCRRTSSSQSFFPSEQTTEMNLLSCPFTREFDDEIAICLSLERHFILNMTNPFSQRNCCREEIDRNPNYMLLYY